MMTGLGPFGHAPRAPSTSGCPARACSTWSRRHDGSGAARRRGGGRQHPGVAPARARPPAPLLLPGGRHPPRAAGGQRASPGPAAGGDPPLRPAPGRPGGGRRRLHPPGAAAGGPPALAGLVAFYWKALDGWLEEDEPALGHARDPYHRVDAVPSSRHVRASLDGVVLADSRRTTVIFETAMGPRWYFREDILVELEQGDAHTVCAYKATPATGRSASLRPQGEHRLDLPGAAPRRPGRRRPGGVLRRARRPGGRRPAHAPPPDPGRRRAGGSGSPSSSRGSTVLSPAAPAVEQDLGADGAGSRPPRRPAGRRRCRGRPARTAARRAG